jgi:predicted small secreted protein
VSRSPRPLVAVLVALLAAALALSACGSGSGSGSDVDALLRDTFARAKPVRSGALDLRIDVDTRGLRGLDGPLAVRLHGPFAARGAGRMPRFDLGLTYQRNGSTLRAGAVSTGRRGWLRLQGQAYTLSDRLFATLARGRRDALGRRGGQPPGVALGALGVDPLAWLKDPQRRGETTLAGAPVVHVTSAVDVPRLLVDVDRLLRRAAVIGLAGGGPAFPPGLAARLRDRIARSVDRATLDVWTGRADHRLRRLTVETQFAVPAAIRGQGTPPQSGTVRFELTLSRLDRPQAITPPAHPRPLADLAGALQQLPGLTAPGP